MRVAGELRTGQRRTPKHVDNARARASAVGAAGAEGRHTLGVNSENDMLSGCGLIIIIILMIAFTQMSFSVCACVAIPGPQKKLQSGFPIKLQLELPLLVSDETCHIYKYWQQFVRLPSLILFFVFF